MKSNLKVIEISFSNIKASKRINTENQIYSKIISNEKSLNNNYSNNLRISLPYKGIKSIKSINNNNNNEININHNSYLSPNSKGKISFLNHFNNNSIYYSNCKNKKTISHFEESKLNTEIKPIKNKLLFTESKIKNTHNIFDLQKNANKRFKKQ